MQRIVRFVVLPSVVLAVALVIAGCTFSFWVDSPSIEGTHWRAMKVVGLDPIPGKEPTLQLGPGHVAGSAGCNGYGSQGLDIGGGAFETGVPIRIDGLGMQAVMCSDEDLMLVEATFFEALLTTDRLRLDDGQLVLAGPTGELIFQQVQIDGT